MLSNKEHTADDTVTTDKTFTSSAGPTYEIDEIARYVEGTGIFHDYRSKNRKVYKPLRLFPFEDIRKLMEYPAIQEAFRRYKDSAALLDYMDGITDETLERMYALAEASKALDEPVIAFDGDQLGAIMGPDVVHLYERLHREGAEAQYERLILTILTSWKNPVDPNDKKFKEFTNYMTNRGGYNVVEDLYKFYKHGRCGAGFNRAFCHLYALVKTHKDVKKILAYQESLKMKV